MAQSGVPYNNRFRRSSSGGPQLSGRDQPVRSVSEAVDLFGHAPQFAPTSPLSSASTDQFFDQTRGVFQRVDSYDPALGREMGAGDRRSSSVGSSVPMAPGKPRRLSRQMSADVKRQSFAASRTLSGDGKHVVTSIDSGCDDVFVEVRADGGGESTSQDGSLFPNKRSGQVTFSTSSTVSILPNPYNRINHRIHSLVWCCSCLYFVFFCCLPAIHYMEQCDREFNRNNQKRARCLGRTASFLFFTGTLIALSLFALIFFLAIFFAVY